MSEVKVPERKYEDVLKEHNQETFMAGRVKYQIYCLEQELNSRLTRILNLNEEGAKLQPPATAPAPESKPDETANK